MAALKYNENSPFQNFHHISFHIRIEQRNRHFSNFVKKVNFPCIFQSGTDLDNWTDKKISVLQGFEHHDFTRILIPPLLTSLTKFEKSIKITLNSIRNVK